MKKITKNINDSNALDFYDTLTDKQSAKFDNEKDSFTIDFVEVSNIYTNLNAEQTGILFLAISMYAATGKKSGIDEEVLDAVNADLKVLIQFNNMANRVKNNTKAWINNRGQAKPRNLSVLAGQLAEPQHLFQVSPGGSPPDLWVCPKFCVNTVWQCKIEPKYFKAGAAAAAAALSTK